MGEPIHDLRAAFKKEHSGLCLYRAKIALIVGISVVPFFAGLDYILARGHFEVFLITRITTTLEALAMLCLIIFSEKMGLKFSSFFVSFYGVTLGAMLSYMCFELGGFNSTYYVGIIIVMLGASLTMPWHPGYHLFMTLGMYASYLFQFFFVGINAPLGTFINNNYFLFAAVGMTYVGSVLQYRMHFQKFQAEQEIRDANVKLQSLDKAKTRFFSNVTHEFRTPLVALSSTIQMILDQGLQDPTLQKRLLSSGKESLEDMLENVNDLLTKSRSEKGMVELKWSEIEIGGFVERALRPLETIASKRGNRLVFTNRLSNAGPSTPPVPPPYKGGESPLMIYADRAKLKKIINNLVGNSLKFTQNGTVEVILGESAGFCIIQVRDTGKGIPAEDLPTIFDPFTQASNNEEREVQGTGLGLSMVRDFVKLHQGEVTVESTIGKGSLFTVKLPLGDAHVDRTKMDTSAIIEEGEDQKAIHLKIKSFDELDLTPFQSKDPRRQNVLLVEDNPHITQVLAYVLRDHYNLDYAKDGREGLEKIGASKPDLVITDIMMPRMNGYEMIQKVKAQPELKRIPIIALTSKSDVESKVKGFEVGADEYLSKPFNNREIITRIKGLLDRRHMEADLTQAEKHASIGVLAGGMAHELNNPVAAIRGYIQDILEDLPEDSPLRKSAEGAERATERCKRIVADLLTFSRDPDLDRTCDLNEAVGQTIAIAKKENDHPNLEWVTHYADDLPPVRIDPLQLRQVLMNLINNARDAINGGGPITVTTRKKDGSLLLEVSDTGAGIPPEIQTKIFDPFFTTKPTGKGMGLGLAMSYNIIKRYQGEITVESQVGQGSRFTIRLPLK